MKSHERGYFMPRFHTAQMKESSWIAYLPIEIDCQWPHITIWWVDLECHMKEKIMQYYAVAPLATEVETAFWPMLFLREGSQDKRTTEKKKRKKKRQNKTKNENKNEQNKEQKITRRRINTQNCCHHGWFFEYQKYRAINKYWKLNIISNYT